MSLGQLYQGGWTIHKDDNSNRLSLQSPGNEISIPVECKNRSFAIKAHVRQVSDVMSSANMALGGNDELMVGTVVCAGVKLKIHLWTPGDDFRWNTILSNVDNRLCEPWECVALLALKNNFDQEVPEGSNMDSCGVVQKVQEHGSTFWDDWSILDYSWFWRWVWIFDIAWCITSNVVGTWSCHDRWWSRMFYVIKRSCRGQVCYANFPQANQWLPNKNVLPPEGYER